MIHHFTPVRKTAILLFLALTSCYLILTPGTTVGRGYVTEEMASGNQLLTNVGSWFNGQPVSPMVWSRHGIVPLLFDLPFLIAGKFLVSQDFILSLAPTLTTSGLMVLVFLWLRKIATPWMSLMLTLVGAFATMLWPYAYIGLETKQSFFVLLAGYIALANGRLRGWLSLALFGIIGGLALTVKITGFLLWPAIAWLVYVQFRDDWRVRRLELMVVSILIAGLCAVGAVLRSPYWASQGGAFRGFRGWMTDSPILIVTNVIAVFGSPVKGLVVFAPVLLLCIYAIPRTFRSAHRDLTVFTLLITGCIVALISLLITPSDETWGPRYMHVAIAPLLLCIGAAWPRFSWKMGLSLAFFGAAGLVCAFLGAFSSYNVPSFAMRDAGQNTMEWINGDPVWSGPVFEARIVGAWLKPGDGPVPWVPTHRWVWEPPKDFPAEWRSVDLREYSTPQSILLQYWGVKEKKEKLPIFRVAVFSAFTAPFLLLFVALRTRKESRGVLP